ncbi:RNA polymerase sigma-70 factor, ECF subfamily [uncultured Gammaproteobacteria bacterium]
MNDPFPKGEDSDADLMARIACGEREAFRTLMDRHLPFVYRLAARVVGNLADAEDVAQEAFLRVWRHADRFQPTAAPFTAWLNRVVVNLCLDRLRKPMPLPLEAAPEADDPAPDGLARLVATDQRKLIAAAVAALPERQRVALVLCYYEEHSNAEAARMLSVTVSALESLLIRARRTLRDRLKMLAPAQGG